MKVWQWIGVFSLLSLAACNLSIGDCYPVGQGPGNPGTGEGDGGSSGASGDAPTECNSSGSDSPVQSAPAEGAPSACAGLSGWPVDGTTYDYCDSACVAQCGVPLMGTFAAPIFKFVTTIADNGKGKAGGWQVANVTLEFDRWTGLLPEEWSCKVAIGFPLRTVAYGVISPAYAAVVSADVANIATSYLMHNPNEITPSIFCNMLPGTMSTVVGTPAYAGLGGRVTMQGVQ